MNNLLKLVRLEENYCNYLRKFDSKIPYNYKNKSLRPFVGVLFEVNNCKYFAPLSSPKVKHIKLKTKLDFLKLDGGKLGAINFNNMLPVTEKNIIEIDLELQPETSSDEKYFKLLKKQLYWLNRNANLLYGRSKKLYDKYLDGTLDKNTRNRCCDFKLLEEKCLEYNK